MKLNQLIQRIAYDNQEKFAFPNDLEDYLDQFVPNVLLKSETLQQAFAVSAYEMEGVYEEGYHLYTEDKYLEASTAFRWLVLLNPFMAKYWKGLGASLQLLKKYEKALHAYALLALLEPKNPDPHFHASQCYAALGNLQESQKAKDHALKIAQLNETKTRF